MSEPVYLDYNASTSIDPRVRAVLIDALTNGIGNPSSAHLYGAQQRSLLEIARQQVAHAVGASANAVTFTSGATEANNLALSGLVRGALNDRHRILVSATEHASVLATAASLDRQGIAKVDIISSTPAGTIDIDHLDELLANDVLLVSVMVANSETGALNPIAEIASRVHAAGAFLHCDATQAVGRVPVDMHNNGIDLLTLSSHKIYGPLGVGACICVGAATRHMVPLIAGGGQESGLRSGTENVASIAAFGKAAELAIAEQSQDMDRIAPLRDQLEAALVARAGGVVNADSAHRIANTSNIWFPEAPSDAVLVNMHNIAASTGSACSSGAPEPSPVLLAMGHDRNRANESIRFSLGRFTTTQDIDTALPQIIAAVERTRTLHTS